MFGKRSIAFLTLVGVVPLTETVEARQSSSRQNLPVCQMRSDGASLTLKKSFGGNMIPELLVRFQPDRKVFSSDEARAQMDGKSGKRFGELIGLYQSFGNGFEAMDMTLTLPDQDYDEPMGAARFGSGTTAFVTKRTLVGSGVSADVSDFGLTNGSFPVTYAWQKGGRKYQATYVFSSVLSNKQIRWANNQLSVLTERWNSGKCRINGTAKVRTRAGRACFLTTAACDVIGLADDCWELESLRRFRDGWLARQPHGRDAIATYYREAPAVAARLRTQPRKLLKLYWTRILPSAIAARFGFNGFAERLYTRMMQDFGVSLSSR
ncbi:MAG: CFI-box-CTERM domain-containing protein [Pseudomonadota bacterium]